MAKMKRLDLNPKYTAIMTDAQLARDKGYCSVVALAVLCDTNYETARRALALAGRKHRHGTHRDIMERAIISMGKGIRNVSLRSFIDRYPGVHKNLKFVTSRHPARFNQVWKDGKRYLLTTKSHYLAVVNGETIDWSTNSALQAYRIQEVI